ncbi:bifunctional diaminohydroxyphosphoribosylaminopyrimidine deaminase/5-amino-6-(5-phosphoribosylamino)uracil reductase RibD [Bacillaceae bacterium S4-13-58]
MTNETYMSLALTMAKETLGQTSPNPVVGCVVVRDGEIVGMGAHLKAGEGHAEVQAIRMAGEKAEGSTVYVTLEPCSHYGKTPPCAELLIHSRVSKVVVATTDPNPTVAGRGIQMLRDAGIEVEVGCLEEEAKELNRFFFHYMTKKTPYVTIKTAMSFDGKIATHTGESKWITSEESRRDVHIERHKHDAILVGVNTVNKDNPSLTTRLPAGGKNPIRVVLDTNLRISPNSSMLLDGKSPLWIITGKTAYQNRDSLRAGNHVEILSVGNDEISIYEVIQILGERKVTSLYVEGGGTINDSFIRSGLFEEIHTYIAPKLIGGKSAPTPIGGIGFNSLADAPLLEIISHEMVGSDFKLVARKKEE